MPCGRTPPEAMPPGRNFAPPWRSIRVAWQLRMRLSSRPAPLLIQAGGANDWTPARHCEAPARQAPLGSVEIDVYPGAFHCFDRPDRRLRERADVGNPNRPEGRGATVGTHPGAREKAIARATGWLEKQDR